MILARSSRTGGRAGFTVIEAALSITIFSMLLGGFLFSVSRLQSVADTRAVQYKLATEALEVVNSIATDLRRSGYTTEGGLDYPLIYSVGETPNGFEAFEHGEIHEITADTAASNELVFLLPDDADDDGWPDVAGAGVLWSPTTVAYILVPNPDGTNSLIRRDSNGNQLTLSRSVTSLTFETPADTGFTIPLDTMRVRVQIAKDGMDGRVYSTESQVVVSLLNGWLAP